MNTEQIKCSDCGKFIKYPYDQRTTFGCANPEAPEPYDPDFYCRKCAKEMYKRLLVSYKCCGRNGDWQKSDAEIRAAKEAGLVWIGNSQTLVEKWSGREISNEYLKDNYKNWGYIPYREYEEKRRKENRCKCYRVKKGKNCPTCSREEIFCLCKYDSFGYF